jgi:hypothetical protein
MRVVGDKIKMDLHTPFRGYNRHMEGNRLRPGSLGLDCSDSVSKFFLAAGLKVRKGNAKIVNAGSPYYMSTLQFIDTIDTKQSCFDDVKLTGESPLLPGDVIVRPGHMVMIDAVLEPNDPFGMNEWDKKDGKPDCTQPNARKFKFDLIQSASMNNKGVIRIPASDFYGREDQYVDRTTLFMMKELASRACRIRFGLKRPGESENARANDNNGKPGLIMRHRMEDPACKALKVEIAGETDCANCEDLK